MDALKLTLEVAQRMMMQQREACVALASHFDGMEEKQKDKDEDVLLGI